MEKLTGFEKELQLLPEPDQLKKIPLPTIHWKIFWISVVSGLITHGYCMFNLISTEDTAGTYSEATTSVLYTFNGASTGRWLSIFINFVQTWYRTPVVSGVWIILILAIMAQILISYFPIRSGVGMVLTGILLEVTSPAQAYMTLYEVGYPLSALFAVVAVWYMKRGRDGGYRYWIGAAICESLALCILPVNIACTITLVVLELLLRCVDPSPVAKNALSYNWRWTFKCILAVLIAGIFLIVSSVFLMSVFDVTSTDYQGAETAISGGFLSSLPANYIHSYVKFFIQGVWKIQTLPAFRFTYWICYALDIFCVIFLFRKKKEKKAGLWGSLVVYLAMLPASICTMSIISYGFMYRGQHRQALILFIIGTIPLTEMVLIHVGDAAKGKKTAGSFKRKTVPGFRKGLYILLSADLGLMCYASFVYSNVGYFNQHHVLMQDQALCIRILSALDQTEGFSYEQPVYFLNIVSWDENEAPTPLKYDPELYSVIWPVATTNLYAYEDFSFKTAMVNFEGIEFVDPTDEQEEEIENAGLREEYEDINFGEFEILKMDDVWVVVVKTVGPPNVNYG